MKRGPCSGGRLYLDASVNDKVDTMTVHQAYDIVAKRLGLFKLKKVRKTAIKERLTDLVTGKVIMTERRGGGSCTGKEAGDRNKDVQNITWSK